MSFDTLEALCRTPHRLVITVCLVLTSPGCMRTAEKILRGRPGDAEAIFNSTSGISSYQERRLG
jgi:hypothetical protein